MVPQAGWAYEGEEEVDPETAGHVLGESVATDGILAPDLEKNMSHELGKDKKLNSKDIKNLEIPSLNYQKAYDFYTITPIVSYSLGGQDFSSYTPGVMFNILMSDEEKIKVIRDN